MGLLFLPTHRKEVTMKNPNLFHRFAVSRKDHERDLLFIDGWLAPIIAWLSVLAISASIVVVLLGER